MQNSGTAVTGFAWALGLAAAWAAFGMAGAPIVRKMLLSVDDQAGKTPARLLVLYGPIPSVYTALAMIMMLLSSALAFFIWGVT